MNKKFLWFKFSPLYLEANNQSIEKQDEVWNGIGDAAKRYSDNKGIITLDNEVICVSGQR